MCLLVDGRHDRGWGILIPKKVINEVPIHSIIRMVCAEENIPITQIFSNQRPKYLVRIRDIARYLAVLYSGKSLMIVAKVFNQDHTSVIHARDKMARLRKTDPELDAKLKSYEWMLVR